MTGIATLYCSPVGQGSSLTTLLIAVVREQKIKVSLVKWPP